MWRMFLGCSSSTQCTSTQYTILHTSGCAGAAYDVMARPLLRRLPTVTNLSMKNCRGCFLHTTPEARDLEEHALGFDVSATVDHIRTRRPAAEFAILTKKKYIYIYNDIVE